MLDRKVQFDKLSKSSKIIGLTATASPDLLKMERFYLSTILNFSIADSHIKPSSSDSVKSVFCDFKDFFSEKYSSLGRIVYCESTAFTQVSEFARYYSNQHLEVHMNCENLLQL